MPEKLAENVRRYLERRVKAETAAKKIAVMRGHFGDRGGWIYTHYGAPICQGWWLYACRFYDEGLLAVDDLDRHKYYVRVAALDEWDTRAAQKVFANRR